MKKCLRSLLLSIVFAFTAMSLSHCATGGHSYDGGVPTYADPDPMTQQIRMQEQMSRVTRSLMPF